MAKKTQSRKKGIQRGVPKHSVRNKNSEETDHSQDGHLPEASKTFLGISQWKIFSLALRVFELNFWICSKLRIVGFTQTDEREFVPLNQRDQIIHYTVIGCGLFMAAQKTWGTLIILLHEELKVDSFMCISLALIYLVTVLISAGVVGQPKETMDLLNSWPKILSSLQDIDPTVKLTPLDDLSASFKVILLFVVTQGIAFAAAMLTLVMSNLTICLFPLAERFGLLPDDLLPRWGWQLVFYPLEYFTYLPPMFLVPYAVGILVTLVGILNIYLRELRKLRVKDFRSRARMEQMYVRLTLFSRIVHVWLRLFLPATLVAGAMTVIVALFIAIRYTELPFIIYIFFPYIGFTVMSVIFWQCYEMVKVGRLTEDILADLRSPTAHYLVHLGKVERMNTLKRAKAMRPLIFPVGNSEFSITVPIDVWEEILNQIVFLLSL